ncbi:DUF1566 domain-containing protein [bacterium]|nr:DUF1566 domain-containing protein [bacterium]
MMFLVKPHVKNHAFRRRAIMISLLLPVCFCAVEKTSDNPIVELRHDYKQLSIKETKMMIEKKGFFDKYWNKTGNFDNDFIKKRVDSVTVVIDRATNLTWHRSGSETLLNLTEANEWINELNRTAYAGLTQWRLPTVEEALSLLENKKKNGNLYIDSIFNSWQWCILTGDSLNSTTSWLVAFSGRIDWFDSNVGVNYVRPVCSM